MHVRNAHVNIKRRVSDLPTYPLSWRSLECVCMCVYVCIRSSRSATFIYHLYSFCIADSWPARSRKVNSKDRLEPARAHARTHARTRVVSLTLTYLNNRPPRFDRIWMTVYFLFLFKMNTKLLTTNFAIDYTECYQVADGYAGMSHPDVSFADANCLIF